jgi:hypothetical protein
MLHTQFDFGFSFWVTLRREAFFGFLLLTVEGGTELEKSGMVKRRSTNLE